jgi:hypothetical protein
MGNHTWTALSFAVHGLTSELRFAEVVSRVAAANDKHELNLPTVAAMCGGNTPALLSHEHHAFVTYAVAVADRAEADAVMRALKAEEAAQFTARALRIGDGAGVAIRDVIYKMAPRGATRGDEDAPESVWANPNVSPPPPPEPPAPAEPNAPPAPFVAPPGAPRKVLVTVAAPTNAVSSPNATTALEKAREAKEALASAADTSDDEPFWNGLADVERDVEIDRVAFTFVAEVVVASDAAVDVDLLCDAVAADLGAVAENSRCALVSTTALVGRYEKHSPEWEAEAEKLRAERARFRKHLRRRRERQEAKARADQDEFQRELDEAAAEQEYDDEGDLGLDGETGTRLVFSAKDVADRAALDAMTSIGSKNAFPTASSLCGGAAVTMEYAHSRAEVTFAVWTTSQQVAATIRAAVVTDAFIEEFGFELGGECELRDARVDQLEDVELGRTNGERTARLAKHRAYASLGGALLEDGVEKTFPSDSKKKSRGSRSRSRSDAPSSELWATVQTPLLGGRDPHDIARDVAPALDAALRKGGARRSGDEKTKAARSAPGARYVGASYVVVSSVLLPGFPVRLEGAAATLGVPKSARALGNAGVVSMAQACAAIAVDLGVNALDAECRFNGTAALGASVSSAERGEDRHKKNGVTVGQSVVILADVGADLKRARAAVERARPERRRAFSTVTAVVGGGENVVGVAEAQYARAEAFLAFAIPVADEAARVVARAALSTKGLDAALSRAVGERAVARAADKAPSAADVAALDPAPDGFFDAPSDAATSRLVASHPELDETVFMRDDPVFERDVPGERGKQGALGGVSRFDETRDAEAKAAAELALRQAKARTAKAQLLALHRMSPRLADLGDGVAPKAAKAGRGELGLLSSTVVLAAAALVAADARRRAPRAGDAGEREPLVRKDTLAAAV